MTEKETAVRKCEGSNPSVVMELIEFDLFLLAHAFNHGSLDVGFSMGWKDSTMDVQSGRIVAMGLSLQRG